MKLIIRIARTELATLFYSPVAWFILIIFSFLSGMQFAGGYDTMFRALELGAYGDRAVSVTEYLFGGSYGLFSAMQNNLYMFIPLLTMGLLSREYSSGSIKLLYSSPLGAGHIVMGKYLSVMLYGAAMLLVPVCGMVWSSLAVPHFDWGFALTALLGVYLLICAYGAIGLFFSSLTSYQVVAAIATLATLTALRFVGQLWQEYDLVRAITHWLSISGRTDLLLNGLVSSADICYFVIVTGLFLALAALRVRFGRSSLRTGARALRYACVVAVALAAGYITSRPRLTAYHDSTDNKRATLSDISRDVMARMDGPLTLTHYVNLFDQTGQPYLPMNRYWGELVFRQYVREKPEMKIEYVYYWDRVPGEDILAQLRLDSLPQAADYLAGVFKLSPRWFKTPEQIKEIADLAPFGNRFVRIAERGDGRWTTIRDFNDMQRTPVEEEITAAFKKMVVDRPPVVGFLAGHGEREAMRPGDMDYMTAVGNTTVRPSLINQGFDIVEVDAERPVGDSVTILVVADPREALSETELGHIAQFVQRGGNMMVLIEPSRAHLLEPLLGMFGVQTAELEEQSAITFSHATDAGAQAIPALRRMLDGRWQVAMPSATSLTVGDSAGWDAVPLLGTGPREQTTAFMFTRDFEGRDQRIIVTGDADWPSNAELRTGREGVRAANFFFLTEVFSTLADGEFPIRIERPEPQDDRFDMPLSSITTVQLLFMLAAPAALLALALIIMFCRRQNESLKNATTE